MQGSVKRGTACAYTAYSLWLVLLYEYKPYELTGGKRYQPL